MGLVRQELTTLPGANYPEGNSKRGERKERLGPRQSNVKPICGPNVNHSLRETSEKRSIEVLPCLPFLF